MKFSTGKIQFQLSVSDLPKQHGSTAATNRTMMNFMLTYSQHNLQVSFKTYSNLLIGFFLIAMFDQAKLRFVYANNRWYATKYSLRNPVYQVP